MHGKGHQVLAGCVMQCRRSCSQLLRMAQEYRACTARKDATKVVGEDQAQPTGGYLEGHWTTNRRDRFVEGRDREGYCLCRIGGSDVTGHK